MYRVDSHATAIWFLLRNSVNQQKHYCVDVWLSLWCPDFKWSQEPKIQATTLAQSSTFVMF